MARAIGGENSEARRRIVQWSTTSPSFAAGMPTTLPGVATRRSVEIASWAPAPNAGPAMAAITGTGSDPNPRRTAPRSVANCPSSTPLRSAPALKAGAAPVSTTARVPSGAVRRISAWISSSSSNVGWSTALRRSGRSSVTIATEPSVRRSTGIRRTLPLVAWGDCMSNPPTDPTEHPPTGSGERPPTGPGERPSAGPDEPSPRPGSDTPVDPVRARRAQVARWTLLANRVGYLFVALAMAVFVIAFVVGFSSLMASIVITTFVIGCVLLAPSIVLGYAVKAAEREDREMGY